MLLVRDKGVYVKDAHIIDIAYDIHVRRVFLRIGLVRSDTLEQVTEVAKLIYPDFQGNLLLLFGLLEGNIADQQTHYVIIVLFLTYVKEKFI